MGYGKVVDRFCVLCSVTVGAQVESVGAQYTETE